MIPPAPPTPPAPEPDAPAAIVRLSLGNVGCTGTIIGPRREDGRYWLLTAAHCVSRVGQQVTARLLDGRTTAFTVAAMNRAADACWCVTETNSVEYPFALLAAASLSRARRCGTRATGATSPATVRTDGSCPAPARQTVSFVFPKK